VLGCVGWVIGPDQVIRRNREVLRELLTDRVDISYNLCSRSHCRVVPEKKGRLADKNVIVRMLYENSQLMNLLTHLYCILSSCVLSAGFRTRINDDVDDCQIILNDMKHNDACIVLGMPFLHES